MIKLIPNKNIKSQTKTQNAESHYIHSKTKTNTQ